MASDLALLPACASASGSSRVGGPFSVTLAPKCLSSSVGWPNRPAIPRSHLGDRERAERRVRDRPIATECSSTRQHEGPVGQHDVGVDKEQELAQRLVAMANGSYREVPLYRRLALSMADREALLDLVLRLPEYVLVGGLLFAAVHYLVLDEQGDPFAEAWRSEARAPGSVSDFEVQFESWVCQREELLAAAVGAHRGAQLNEVNRCSYLLPALAAVAKDRNRDVALLDVGTSAGLTLNLEHYQYRYGETTYGSPSPVLIEAQVRGRREPPVDAPAIRWRLGLDRSPLDITDPRSALWLQAQVYPHDFDRIDRLRAAIDVTRTHPVRVVRGEASDIADFAAGVPQDLTLVIVSTALLMYLDGGSRLAMRGAIERIAHSGMVEWLVCEHPAVLASLGEDVAHVVEPWIDASDFVGPLLRISAGHPPQLLAITGAHGRWIEWRA